MLRPKCQNSARTTIFKSFTPIFFNLNKIVEKFSLVREHLDVKNLNFEKLFQLKAWEIFLTNPRS